MTEDEFIEPLNDPRFPDRPNHDDFWRMSEVVLKHDGDERGIEAIVSPIVDIDSLMYMATQRVAMAMNAGHEEGSAMLAVFIDAFTMGADFQKAGGHRA